MAALPCRGSRVNDPFPLSSTITRTAGWSLGDGLALRRDGVLRERKVLIGVHAIARRVDDRGLDEDDQAGLLALGRFVAEQSADDRQLAQHRHLDFRLGPLI